MSFLVFALSLLIVHYYTRYCIDEDWKEAIDAQKRLINAQEELIASLKQINTDYKAAIEEIFEND